MNLQYPFIPRRNLSQFAIMPETRVEIPEELVNPCMGFAKRVEMPQEVNQDFPNRIKMKDEEVGHYAERMGKEEERAKKLQEERDELQRRLWKEEERANKLQKERDKFETRLWKEEERANKLQKERDKFETRLRQVEMDSKKELENYKGRLTQQDQNTKGLQKAYQGMKQRYADLREGFNQYTKDMQGELERIDNQLYEKDNQLRRLSEELKIKTQRLASTYERRLKIRQVNVENTTQLNSPSEVEKDFRDFLDEERTEAWEIIENSLFSTRTDENDVKIRYLACMIFVAAFEQMEQTREAAKDFFNNISRHLIDEAPRRSQELCVKRMEDGCFTQFPVQFNISVEHQEWDDNKDVLDDLMLSLKQSAHSCDLKCFEKDVRQIVLKKWEKCLKEEKEMTLVPPFPDKPEDVLTKLGDYIKDCIRLSWKMVTQAPPLGLENSQLKFNPKYHTLTRLQNNNESSKQGQYESIVYLWPGLKENEGRVIFPGEVLCIQSTTFNI